MHLGGRRIGIVGRQHLDILFHYIRRRFDPFHVLAHLLVEPTQVVTATQMLGHVFLAQRMHDLLARQALGDHNPSALASATPLAGRGLAVAILGKSIFQYAGNSNGADDYRQLAAELHGTASPLPAGT
jgi:hypothetical protein